MKTTGIIASLFLSISLLSVTSCGKNSVSSPAKIPVTPVTNTDKISIPETKLDSVANHSVKTINLRQASEFAVFANTSISSIPSSSITGKLGIRPGTKAQIMIDPSEVVGGGQNILASDDADVAISSFVFKAKTDVINAYNEMENRVADADKLELWNGNLGHKVLAAGVYQWKSRVTIPEDLKLEGNDTDVWVFKVTGQLRVGTNVHVTLSGGALAKNVFWQIGDDVLIKAKSEMVGTIISQQTFEMKELASLNGRAITKNDKLILDKNIITIP